MTSVSVVVPTYERIDKLQRAIRSVLKQTITDIEIIVVDDASTDDTKSVVSEYNDPRIKYIRHEENRGGAAARNTGINAAEGEFIAFLDDDDEWRPGKLAAQLDAYGRANTDTGVVYTGIENVDANGQTNSVKTSQIEGDVTRELLLHNFIGSFSALIVDRQTIEKVELLDEQFASWQDWEYYIRLSQKSEFTAVPEPLVVRHNANHEQISDNVEEKITKTYPLFREKFEDLAMERGRKFKRRWRSHLLFHMGYAALSGGRYALACRLFVRALWYDPTNKQSYLYLLLALGGEYTYPPVQTLKRWLVRHFGRAV